MPNNQNLTYLQSGKTLAFVEQEIANSDKPALEFVLDGDV